MSEREMVMVIVTGVIILVVSRYINKMVEKKQEEGM